MHMSSIPASPSGAGAGTSYGSPPPFGSTSTKPGPATSSVASTSSSCAAARLIPKPPAPLLLAASRAASRSGARLAARVSAERGIGRVRANPGARACVRLCVSDVVVPGRGVGRAPVCSGQRPSVRGKRAALQGARWRRSFVATTDDEEVSRLFCGRQEEKRVHDFDRCRGHVEDAVEHLGDWLARQHNSRHSPTMRTGIASFKTASTRRTFERCPKTFSWTASWCGSPGLERTIGSKTSGSWTLRPTPTTAACSR